MQIQDASLETLDVLFARRFFELRSKARRSSLLSEGCCMSTKITLPVLCFTPCSSIDQVPAADLPFYETAGKHLYGRDVEIINEVHAEILGSRAAELEALPLKEPAAKWLMREGRVKCASMLIITHSHPPPLPENLISASMLSSSFASSCWRVHIA